MYRCNLTAALHPMPSPLGKGDRRQAVDEGWGAVAFISMQLSSQCANTIIRPRSARPPSPRGRHCFAATRASIANKKRSRRSPFAIGRAACARRLPQAKSHRRALTQPALRRLFPTGRKNRPAITTGRLSGLAEFVRSTKRFKSVFPATCAAEKLLRAQLMQAPRADQAGPKPRAISASIQKKKPCPQAGLLFLMVYTSSMTAISAASPRRVPMRVMRV